MTTWRVEIGGLTLTGGAVVQEIRIPANTIKNTHA